jgi:hypothetical protein
MQTENLLWKIDGLNAAMTFQHWHGALPEGEVYYKLAFEKALGVPL